MAVQTLSTCRVSCWAVGAADSNHLHNTVAVNLQHGQSFHASTPSGFLHGSVLSLNPVSDSLSIWLPTKLQKD